MHDIAHNDTIKKALTLCIRWVIPMMVGGLISFFIIWHCNLFKHHSPPYSFSKVIKSTSPAVVNISTEKKRLGSGVIMSKSGHIITNHHVIRDAGIITVSLEDGRTTTAAILGSDIESDITILKIQLDNLHTPPIQQGAELEVGEIVLAIGNPFGVGQTVTQGIVSATDRSGLGLSTFEQYIQTDAAINPGNSGGALINAQGYLVGINSAFLSHAEGAQGISFAIPITQIQSIMDDIISYGGVERGYLGVKLHQLTKETASFFNLQHTNGLVIVEIDPESPASENELQTGDVILSINDLPLSEGKEALSVISRLRPGSKALLTLYRSGKQTRVSTLLAKRSNKPANFQ